VRCVHQDAWFRDIAGVVLAAILDDIQMNLASLTLHIDIDTPFALFDDISALELFFDEDMLLTDHMNQLNVVSSLIEPFLRLILKTTSPDWRLFAPGKGIIAITLKLIPGSSDLESACTTARSLSTIAVLISLLSYCDVMRRSINNPATMRDFEALVHTTHYLLCVVATPFTGLTVVSNSNSLSALKKHGWPGAGLAPSISCNFISL